MAKSRKRLSPFHRKRLKLPKSPPRFSNANVLHSYETACVAIDDNGVLWRIDAYDATATRVSFDKPRAA